MWNEKTHGLSNHALYKVWRSIKRRCYSPKELIYKYYGAKGVKICDEWMDPVAFINWAIENGWEKGLQVDRFPDKTGDYSPLNCRLVTSKINNRNKTNNILYEYKGESKTLVEWGEIYKVSYTTLRSRIETGLSIEEAIKKPRNMHKHSQIFELNGVRKILTDWSREYNISDRLIMYRIKKGWSFEKSITTPVLKPGMRHIITIAAIFIWMGANSQIKYEQPKIKAYIPSAAFFFASGMMQGSRDASLFYHIKNGGFFDGRTSWKRKYKNGDYTQGEAFPLSTTVLAPFTDNVHFAPMMANNFDAWGAVMLPVDNNRRFGHLLLKVAAITAIRSAGHFVMYDIIIPNGNRNEIR